MLLCCALLQVPRTFKLGFLWEDLSLFAALTAEPSRTKTRGQLSSGAACHAVAAAHALSPLSYSLAGRSPCLHGLSVGMLLHLAPPSALPSPSTSSHPCHRSSLIGDSPAFTHSAPQSSLPHSYLVTPVQQHPGSYEQDRINHSSSLCCFAPMTE